LTLASTVPRLIAKVRLSRGSLEAGEVASMV
jgi:hypothetical protein